MHFIFNPEKFFCFIDLKVLADLIIRILDLICRKLTIQTNIESGNCHSVPAKSGRQFFN
jgi:hypothetical protein